MFHKCTENPVCAPKNGSKTGLTRRAALKALSVSALAAAFGMPFTSTARGSAPGRIPILMFHRVADVPRFPEDIAPEELSALFANAWKQRFYPVSVSDILADRVDAVVPKGFMPLCITIDDAHPSVFFTAKDGPARNSADFMSLFRESLRPWKISPRATIFVSGSLQAQNEIPRSFGGRTPIGKLLDTLEDGVEMGFHTVGHTRMTGMNARQTRELVEKQRNAFREAGVLERIAPVFAYPYGCRPKEDGSLALADLGFSGAVLAFPGVHEARYGELPVCLYDGALQTDRFLLPRVAIGPLAYAPPKNAYNARYLPQDTLADFTKDALNPAPALYVSRGAANQSR